MVWKVTVCVLRACANVVFPLQDNIATRASEGKASSTWRTLADSVLYSGMNTTAGSFALLGSVVPDDAGVVKRLRKAGAIILGACVDHPRYT